MKKELWRKKILHIGCHLSSSKGFAAMGETAVSIGADTFAFFTRNPRGGSAKAADPADGAALNEVLPLAEHTTVLLETMAGKGSEIGRNFEELKAIIDGVDEKIRSRLAWKHWWV